MTFDEMCTFVRAHADTDPIDATQANLTVYARMAYNDILSRQLSWPHLEVSYTLNTVNGTSTYAISGIGVGDLDRIGSLIDAYNANRLMPITQTDADVIFGLRTTTGSPQAWAQVGANIVLYPTPSSALALTVRGTRSEVAWPAAIGSTPDLPSVFHEAIAWYMLSSYYLAQEDTSLAGVYLNEYNQMVTKYTTSETKKTQMPRPMIFGQNNGGRGRNFMDRVRGAVE